MPRHFLHWTSTHGLQCIDPSYLQQSPVVHASVLLEFS